MVIIKGMKAWMPNMRRNMAGVMTRINLKYIFPMSGPAYAAGARAQNTVSFSPRSGRCSLAKATSAWVVPCEWQMRPILAKPVS